MTIMAKADRVKPWSKALCCLASLCMYSNGSVNGDQMLEVLQLDQGGIVRL